MIKCTRNFWIADYIRNVFGNALAFLECTENSWDVTRILEVFQSLPKWISYILIAPSSHHSIAIDWETGSLWPKISKPSGFPFLFFANFQFVLINMEFKHHVELYFVFQSVYVQFLIFYEIKELTLQKPFFYESGNIKFLKEVKSLYNSDSCIVYGHGIFCE